MSGGPLLERHTELVRLAAAVRAAATGRGRVALVTGEAGIGKTSLVRAFLGTLGRDVRVLRGACDDLLAPRPLAPLREAVRDSAGPLARALDTSAAADAALSAVVEELAAQVPTVLVVEDLHWADDATIDVLRYLVRRIDTLPAVLVLTVREDEIAANQQLLQLLGAVAGPESVRLELEPLSTAAVAELAGPAGRDTGALHALTAGNPFYVTEALAAPPDALPISVADAVRARIRPLGPHCAAALEQLSVVPGVVEFPLAEALLPDRMDELARAEERGILAVRENGLAFRHELARRAVEAALPRLRRRALNLAVVRVLRGIPDIDLERVVHHAVQADDAATIVEFAPRAAHAAAASGSHRQALTHLEATVRHVHRLPPAEQATVIDEYGWELHLAHRLDDAVAAGRDAVARFERLGHPVGLGTALVRLSRHEFMSGDTEEAERLIGRAVTVLESAGSDVASAAASTDRAALLTLTGQTREALPVLEAALELARRAQRPDLQSLCLNYRGLARAHHDDVDGAPDMREAIAVATTNGCHEAAARAYINFGELLQCSGRWVEMAQCVEDGLAYIREFGLWQHAQLAGVQRHLLQMHHGDWDAAEEGLRRLVEQSTRSVFDVHRLPVYGRLLARRGREDAEQVLDRAWRHASQQRAPIGMARAATGLVEWAWLNEQPDRARRAAEEVLPWMRGGAWNTMRGELLRHLARAGIDPGPFPGCPEPWAAGLRGDWEAAAAEWARIGDPYERALELTESGEAGPALEGLRVLDELGAAAAAVVRRRLRERGLRPPPQRRTDRKRSHPAGLTDREIDVLDLVAQGSTNAEIAAKLVLSVRTVDHHVSSILGKLGARTRREAVAARRALEPS
ncbi:regulatory LuxR family protein [Pseudonocardia hierapolitana]|uniref:Regulatory LuxR family protein n=1 Tax=Pseudonocardia hierapolitana TaxID=1128676 RepID=A0A561SHR6_9PSEU|nr:LuxR family transcriptional regulator [Pseudonocardia hierapolitana]TWF74426.1 regulatory LuxR family protein [Pseudonocardia hierapolitana]